MEHEGNKPIFILWVGGVQEFSPLAWGAGVQPPWVGCRSSTPLFGVQEFRPPVWGAVAQTPCVGCRSSDPLCGVHEFRPCCFIEFNYCFSSLIKKRFQDLEILRFRDFLQLPSGEAMWALNSKPVTICCTSMGFQLLKKYYSFKKKYYSYLKKYYSFKKVLLIFHVKCFGGGVSVC